MVVDGAEKTLLTPDMIASAMNLGLDDVWRLSGFTAVLSNIMSNVPAVLAPGPSYLARKTPSVPGGHHHELDAGQQFTLLGSVANLVVAEQARAAGTPLSFGAFFKVGLPLTVVTLGVGTAWLPLRSYARRLILIGIYLWFLRRRAVN